MANTRIPKRIINSAAPVRMCDNGGWTDTWFAQYGCVTHIAVTPCVEVQVLEFEPLQNGTNFRIRAVNYGDDYTYTLQSSADFNWGKHPLLEAAIETMQPPEGSNLEIHLYSRAPGGASIGTSASVSVALIGALNLLLGRNLSRAEIARKAHQVETNYLKQQSGIQDQLAAAFGGINYIEMNSFPDATVHPLEISEQLRREFEQRLVLIYIGKPHRSTQVHEMVIRHLEDAGSECQELADLRQTARQAHTAILAGDLQVFGASLIENNRAQKRLHPQLISQDSEAIIQIAKDYDAIGWKVNGAGGEGGSVSILSSPLADQKLAMLRTITRANPAYQVIPVTLSRDGLRVWEA